MHIFEFFTLIRTAGESQVMKIITVYPQWDLNPCGKLHGNPSNSCWDTLLRIDCLSGRSSVNHNCLYQICPVELYHKISKTWGHQRQYNSSSEDHECQSNIVILRAVSMAEKKNQPAQMVKSDDVFQIQVMPSVGCHGFLTSLLMSRSNSRVKWKTEFGLDTRRALD